MRWAILSLLLPLAACNSSRRPPMELIPDMKHQLKYKPQTASPLFADGRSSRPPVPGTIARGDFKEDESVPPQNPLPMTRETLLRGQERYNIYCSACHDRSGSGRGIVALRSSWLAGNLTEQRIRDLADGDIFTTISVGKRTMPGYRFQIPEQDRWAIVAYVRALQRAANGTIDDVPPELRSELR